MPDPNVIEIAIKPTVGTGRGNLLSALSALALEDPPRAAYRAPRSSASPDHRFNIVTSRSS